jgi:hypothetical protein
MADYTKWFLSSANSMFNTVSATVLGAATPVTDPVADQLSALSTYRHDLLKSHHLTYRTCEMFGLTVLALVASRSVGRRALRNVTYTALVGGTIWTPELVNPFNRV